ncbi:hypothetical protein KAR91_49915 [Candidatus Pacearchaeota archaeon]|nr:hypothetical protein [Candidatus Pacearchaeota archaeon]
MNRNRRHKKLYEDPDWLYNKYVCEQLNVNQICDIVGGSKELIGHWLKKHKIHRKRIPRARKRRRNKIAALEYKRGKCQLCGYDKCVKALEFHHVQPEHKRFTISQGLEKHWPSLKKEIDKCLLVCKNCHTEAHSALISQEYMERLLQEDLDRHGSKN